MIRIAFLLGSLQVGGSERQVLGTLKVLDRQRFAPLLYVTYRVGELSGDVPADVPVYSYWENRRPPFVYFPGFIRWQQSRQLARWLAAERIQVVYDRNFEVTLLSAAACRIRPTPRVSVVSANPDLDLAINGGRFRWFKRRLLEWAYRSAAQVVAVSAGVAAALQKSYRVPASNVTTIPSSVDVDEVRCRATDFVPPFQRNRFNIVCVGRLEREKGYSYLIRAIDDLVHHRTGFQHLLLWIVGAGSLESDLRELLQQLDLESHVRLVGFLANPIPYMKAASLFCLPSLSEGMPNSLQEAVCCEVPVLACDCPYGPAEILKSGTLGGLVPPANSAALAAAIADAVANYSAWQARTADAREHVERHFSRRASVAALERLLSEVAGAGSEAAAAGG